MGCWSDCTVAAEKIAYLLQAYRNSYTFRRVPYQLCYATYVASTILVRNANNMIDESKSVRHLAICLKAFEEMKIAHPGTTRMENVIRSLMRRLSVNVDFYDLSASEAESPGKLHPDDRVVLTYEASNHTFLPSLRSSTIHPSADDLNTETVAIPRSYASRCQNELGHMASASNPGMDFQMMGMTNGQYQDMGVQGISPPIEFNWDISSERINDDMLFGVLGEDYI